MKIELINFNDVSFAEKMKSLQWRNSDVVTRNFQRQNITEEQHKSWLKLMELESPQVIAFMIKFDEKYIGVSYFHTIVYEARHCDWGIYIHDELYHGKGIGKRVLLQMMQYAKDRLSMKKVFLEVLIGNEKAWSLYENAGFRRVKNDDSNILRYEKILQSKD